MIMTDEDLNAINPAVPDRIGPLVGTPHTLLRITESTVMMSFLRLCTPC